MLRNQERLYKALILILISFLSLFFEVALIRWIPGQVRIFGYFTNLVLIATFLGLGIGCATAHERKNNEWKFPILLAFLVILCLGIKKLGSLPITERWGEIYFSSSELGVVPLFLSAIIIFAVATIVQIPLGRMIGMALEPFPPLLAYSLNLIGSLLGVAVMAIFNLLSTKPTLWFTLGLFLYLPFLFSIKGLKMKVVSIIASATVIMLVFFATSDEIWSPYYKIKFKKSLDIELPYLKKSIPLEDSGYSLTINDNFFQLALNLSPEHIKSLGDDQIFQKKILERFYKLYNLPFLIYKPKSVLIVGAGAGNDVALAVQNKIPKVVAVEIDPVIARLGLEHHPEYPYLKPGVSLVIDDARHYIKTTKEKFDMIIYGLLDAHRLVSYISIVRQDSFVYTYEGLKEASLRLNPDGILIVSNFSTGTSSIQAMRLFNILNMIFPNQVYALRMKEVLLGSPYWDIYVASPKTIGHSIKSLSGVEDVTHLYHYAEQVKLPTDNWPFLYLTTKEFWKTDYFKTLLILLLISSLIIFINIPEAKQINLHFFLLGAGFLLLETKSIVELSLFFGSTWFVNTIAISAFLFMAILANISVEIFKLKRLWLVYLFLILALILNFSFPISKWKLSSRALLAVLSSGFLALPVFFSGIIFALNFKKVKSAPLALGANILGACVGGFLEYASLFFGYRHFYIIAIILYLLSWLFYKINSSKI